MRWFFKANYRSFYLLNATQFLGALNDNIFKLLVIYLLINVQGPAAAPAILSLVGAIFVIPFLLFSSGAGLLADRISKRSIIVFTKVLEVVIMLFGLAAAYLESGVMSYTALFFMATQSAIFGPSKYGIIPELVEEKMVSKANGSMTSFTYLAIILGTFLASFLTDITNKNFILVSCFCVFIAILGLLASLGISRTAPQNSPKRITPLFLYEIYQTLKTSWHVPHLLPSIFGSAFFLFMGAFAQLNIIPFAMQSLHLSEVGGGYLFLATAVGIVIGAILAGQLSKDKVEPGISCICGVFIGLLLILLHFLSFSLTLVIICLTLLGVFGGAFLIPFDSFIQVYSPDEKRGQVIAASNFFSFIGVLFASFSLFAISGEMQLSSSTGFALVGVISLIINTILTGRISDLFLPFLARKALKRVRTLKLKDPIPDTSTIVVLQNNSWWDAILLFAVFPRLRVLYPKNIFRGFPYFNGWFESIRLIPPDPDAEDIEDIFSSEKTPTNYCIFLNNISEKRQIIQTYEPLLNRKGFNVLFAHGTKEKAPRYFLFFKYFQKNITMHFTKDR